MTADSEKKVEKVFAALICESCGESFFCGANIGDCWCFAVELKAESLADFREKYKNCLCENCLQNTKRLRCSEG